MKKSRLIGKKNHRSKSELLISSLSPSLKSHNPYNDPFLLLQRNASTKLLPVSPCGLKLPSLHNRSSPANTAKSFTTRTNAPCVLKFEALFQFNRLKVVDKKEAQQPKTPYFKLRRNAPSLNTKEFLSARNRMSEVNVVDVSFGNHN
ncbi:hypothetical protein SteCoe_17138 [Stentor coeruleus]|uniref:Uncharacterized protein n=1 Tax=Stentor coeruleus TaxID=5963 RepID=A0A1R2BZM2_9CILI|nr:hypothetical protein SteCoe_17138 [Stentor coeruleus]